jgi:predicted lipoprotein with Yx(FWY)xxD motif
VRRFLVASAATLVIVLWVGGGGAAAGATAAGTTASRHPAPSRAAPVTNPAPGTLRVSNTALGPVLVDARGRTLYARDRDTRTRVTCTGRCAKRWPPLLVAGRPTPGCPCVDPAKLATVQGRNGRQVTYAGHPLYRSTRDRAAGDTNGQGRQGFAVVDEHGNRVTAPTVASTGS